MFKDILVHLDNGARDATRLAVATDLARRHGAHLTGIFVAGPPAGDMFLGAGMAVGAAAEMDRLIGSLSASNAARADNAGQVFRDALRRDGLEGEWRAVEGDIAVQVALHTRYADLAVVGQYNPEDGSQGPGADSLVANIVLSSGRPVLAVPYAGAFQRVGQRAVVAWNASREATRAVNDALPLLRMAEAVTVLAINPKRGIEGHGDVPAADICLHLARHGVKAEAAYTVAKDIGDGDALLSYVSDNGADLIVCGGYGHSRLREMVFGGVTRTLLEAMTVPVFLSH